MANENTVVKKPSTTIGVDKYTFFKVDQDTVTELTYGTGYTLPGTVKSHQPTVATVIRSTLIITHTKSAHILKNRDTTSKMQIFHHR